MLGIFIPQYEYDRDSVCLKANLCGVILKLNWATNLWLKYLTTEKREEGCHPFEYIELTKK